MGDQELNHIPLTYAVISDDGKSVWRMKIDRGPCEVISDLGPNESPYSVVATINCTDRNCRKLNHHHNKYVRGLGGR